MTTEEPTRVIPPNIIAYVLDNTVEQITHVNDRTAAILLSEPLILNVTDRGIRAVQKGDIYDPETNTFTRRTE